MLLCHKDEMLSPTYEIATYTLCHTEELVSRPYEIVIYCLLCHTDEMLSPTYEIATDLMSYGRDSNSYVWDRCTIAMSYGWDVKSSVGVNSSGYVTDELISPPYDIAIVIISYGRVTKSPVWDTMMSKKNMGWPFYAVVATKWCTKLEVA